MTQKNTRDLIFEKMLAWGQNHELDARYPNRTHFIAADGPQHDRMATEVLREGNPVVLVYPDGRELLIRPESDGGPSLEARDSSGLPIAA
jgi:hypothetical protein